MNLEIIGIYCNLVLLIPAILFFSFMGYKFSNGKQAEYIIGLILVSFCCFLLAGIPFLYPIFIVFISIIFSLYKLGEFFNKENK